MTAADFPPSSLSVSPAVTEVTRASLAKLREERLLSGDAWDAAMVFCGFRPDGAAWRAYWRHLLLLGGALFLAAGVIFFIAANWPEMHPFTRMALVGALVGVTGLGAVWVGPDTVPGRVLLLSSGICVGPLLAVFGQTYQTGAELWELFRVWTVVLFALALAGRQAALWFVTWLSANVFVMLWLGRSMGSPLEAVGMFSLLPECVLGLALAVAIWEWAAYRACRKGDAEAHAWLRSRWLPRLLFFDLTVRLTAYLCLLILDPSFIRHQAVLLLPNHLLPFLAVFVAGVSWYWHRKKTPDLFMFACIVTACAVLIVAVLLKGEFLFDAGIGAVFVWGMLIVGLTAGVAAILLALQRQMEDGERKASGVRSGALVKSFFMPARRPPDWDALLAFLKEKGHVAADANLPVLAVNEDAPSSPWYVRVILAVGGWIAALVFLIFLALFLFLSLEIRSNEGAALAVASLFPLGIAYLCLKASGIFLRNFGFSLALTGTAGACFGLCWMLPHWSILPFALVLLIGVLCFVMNSAPYRFLAAFCMVQLVAVGIVSLVVGGADLWAAGETGRFFDLYRRGLNVTILWWTALAVGLAAFLLHANPWRGLPGGKHPEPLFYGAYGGMMGYCVLALSLLAGGMADIRELGVGLVHLPAGAYSVGLGAAAGLVFFVYSLFRGEGASPERILMVACAALALPIGWHLPGVALAALGLALSRYVGGLVMQGVTGAFLLAYVVYYYYFLGIPLLRKSLLLAATGAALLVLAWCLHRFGSWFGEREAGHA
ncbi:MAG: DUF4401 domain-containing protein [Deltaproteobacteria bacterium]|nr:DUF4401 domain-containing protein [Deltaproteobacteria bacterium]